MRLHVIKAKFGDSIMLETAHGLVLVDGGPARVWETSLQPYLAATASERGLAAVVISHVDRDHIIGVLDLFAENERRVAAGERAAFPVGDLWHNAFERTIDPTGTIVAALQQVAAKSMTYGVTAAETNHAIQSVADGEKLRRDAVRAKTPINAAFGNALLCPDLLVQTTAHVAGMGFTVIGPTMANLEALRKEWLAWARKAKTLKAQDFANSDTSVRNKSSIVLLVEHAGKRALLTGDARGDHIEQGLDQAGLRVAGRVHVDVLKVQHHGSAHNAERGFFDRVTADTYVISADGKDDNPDYETLTWIVETAHVAGRNIEIVVTHDTPSVKRLRKTYSQQDFGYALRLPEAGAHAAIVTL